MDWGKMAELWGPAIPMYLVIIWYQHRMIFQVIPQGFRECRSSIEAADRRAELRHAELMAEFRSHDDYSRGYAKKRSPARKPMVRKTKK